MTSPGNADSVARFDDRATDYVRYRPSYPAAAIDAVLDGLGPPDMLAAADIGAGTGISARLLADRGATVIAIEPGVAMRGAADPHPRVTWVASRAEATAIASGACDLILCAQAFHWLQPADALPEFARVLRPGGRLALMWNRRSQSDPFTVGYREAILAVSGDSVAERMAFNPAVLPESGCFSAAERIEVSNVQHLDLTGLIGRARSASYVPKDGENGERLVQSLTALYRAHADATGRVTLRYETEIYRSTRI
jgi:SAM-dependent methyltransferase